MLVAQGLEDCEVIVVNDGSTDNTEQICNSFVSIYPHITLVSLSKNSGVSVARNTGLAKASGRYVCFFDSDDTFTANTLSYFRRTIDEQKGIDVYCFESEVKINGKVRKKNTANLKYSEKVFNGHFDFLKLVLRKHVQCHIIGGTLISHELLRSNDITFMNKMTIGEDLEFMIHVISSSKSIYYNSRICYIYHIRENSATKGYKSYSIQQFNAYIIIDKYLQGLIEKNSDLSMSAYFYLANLYVANLYFYLKSDIRDNVINRLFIENRKILYKNYSGQTARMLLFYVLRFVPIRLLFYIFRKNCI
jgi:glycosyltransferase involved in cell wall biosynthesis